MNGLSVMLVRRENAVRGSHCNPIVREHAFHRFALRFAVLFRGEEGLNGFVILPDREAQDLVRFGHGLETFSADEARNMSEVRLNLLGLREETILLSLKQSDFEQDYNISHEFLLNFEMVQLRRVHHSYLKPI